MNPDQPLTPREETEVRLTALLMGELPPDEAAALHAQIAAAPALAKLHARLRQAMELLREATALPDHPAPAQLSPERRERLLAHFKNPAPAPARVIVQPRRDWSWAVPLGLAAALIALLGGTVLMSGFVVRFPRIEEPPDFASADSAQDLSLGQIRDAEPAAAATKWASQPGAIRPYGETEIRQKLAGTGRAAGENSARYAFTPPPPAVPAGIPAAAPLDSLSAVTATAAAPVFKLYSSDALTAGTDASATAPALAATTVTAGTTSLASSLAPAPATPAPLLDLFDLPVVEPYTISEPLSTAGKVNISHSIAAFQPAPAGPGTSDRGFVQQADGLARHKSVEGVVAGSGALTFSGGASSIELPALVVTGGGTAAQGISPKPASAKTKSTPAPVTAPAAPALAQSHFFSDFDTDGSIKLGDTRMPARGEIGGVATLNSDLNEPALRPDLSPANAPEKPALESSFGRKPAEKSAAEEELRETVKLTDAQHEFGLRGANAYTGGTAIVGGVIAKTDDANLLGWLEKPAALAKNLADQPTSELEVRRAPLLEEATVREYQRSPNQVVLERAPAAVTMAPAAPAGFATRDTNGALGLDTKLAPKAVEFEGFINYGDAIQPADASKSRVTATGRASVAEGSREVEITAKSVEIRQNNLAELNFQALGLESADKKMKDALDLDGFSNEDEWKGKPVARTGFWVDDESAKQNINTAAEGIFGSTRTPKAQRDLQTRSDVAHEKPVALKESLAENDTKRKQLEEIRAKIREGADVGDLARMYSEDVGKDPAARAAFDKVLIDAIDADSLADQSAVIRQKAGPNVLRSLAAASLKDEKIKDLLTKHGYQIVPAPAPAPVAASAEKVMEVAKLESVKLAEKGKKVAMEEEVLARKTAAPAPVPQPEIATSANAFSTFSLNVSDVAFKLAAASLEQGKMPDVATVRSEEFINAFDYRDPEPAAGAALACTTERARYPFAQNRDLLRCSVKTAAAGRQPGRPLNIVLLLDNSGSMERADRVRILHEALRVLAAQLQPQDKLSVVTFARTPRLWADGVAGDKAGEKMARVGEITPQGGTNLEAALDLGYATALRHFQVGSINRVVLLTDGAANLGDVNPDALKQKVEANRQKGVALDCFGIGWEGLDDTLLEALSRNGDGRYGFINTPEEAATGFAAQLAGALRVAASDVKVQVEWNPRRVTAYRQIGYAKHQLKKEQFRDNTVDAAEIGAAESGNALYVCEVNPRGEGDLATVRVRYKVPGTSDYREHEWTVPFTKDAPPLEQASPALRLAGTASAFSEWLTASPYAAEVTPDRLLGLLNGVPAIYGADPRPQKLEWMIRTAKSVSGR